MRKSSSTSPVEQILIIFDIKPSTFIVEDNKFPEKIDFLFSFTTMFLFLSASFLFICLTIEGAFSDSILPLGDGEIQRKKPEDAIPVIEVRGEGKPMSAAQIRELEEAANGGPLDIKITRIWVPRNCARKARRLDFVNFHYRGLLETGKLFDSTRSREPEGVRIQLGVGMAMPGLDKALKGMCPGEQRRVDVPYRLSRKAKSRVWKHIPNEEHWLRFELELVRVEPWTVELQFRELDLNNDSRIDEAELVRWEQRVRREYGKRWPNPDVDTVLATRYYVRYFDVNRDGKVQLDELKRVFRRDLAAMEKARKVRIRNPSKNNADRKRDPGLAWVLDLNNDGMVSTEELEEAVEVVQQKEPRLLPRFDDRQEL